MNTAPASLLLKSERRSPSVGETRQAWCLKHRMKTPHEWNGSKWVCLWNKDEAGKPIH